MSEETSTYFATRIQPTNIRCHRLDIGMIVWYSFLRSGFSRPSFCKACIVKIERTTLNCAGLIWLDTGIGKLTCTTARYISFSQEDARDLAERIGRSRLFLIYEIPEEAK